MNARRRHVRMVAHVMTLSMSFSVTVHRSGLGKDVKHVSITSLTLRGENYNSIIRMTS